MEDIRPNLGSKLKKIRGSKVSLESPGYADYHTRSLTMRLLGKNSVGRENEGVLIENHPKNV